MSVLTFAAVDAVLDHAHKLGDADLVVKPYFDFLQPMESSALQDSESESQDITDSQDVNDSQMQTSPPIVVNSSSPLAASTSSGQTALEPPAAYAAEEEAAEEDMDHQIEDTDSLPSHIAVTDPLKHSLLQCSVFLRDLKKANPNFTIQINDDGVYIAGPDKLQVEQLKHTISDFLGNMTETDFTLEPEMAQFLGKNDVKKYLLESLNKTDSSTVYTVSNSKVMVTSLSQHSATQACSFLKSQVCRFSIPMDTENEGLLYCREWSEFLEALRFSSVKVSEQGGNIDVLTLKGMENEKQTAILSFLSTPIERETVISMEPGMLKYIQIHCHQLLADMDQVSIFPLEAEDSCGLKVCDISVFHVKACNVTDGKCP